MPEVVLSVMGIYFRYSVGSNSGAAAWQWFALAVLQLFRVITYGKGPTLGQARVMISDPQTLYTWYCRCVRVVFTARSDDLERVGPDGYRGTPGKRAR
jgi:hypothetical protein